MKTLACMSTGVEIGLQFTMLAQEYREQTDAE
jgi:hypothetical protein